MELTLQLSGSNAGNPVKTRVLERSDIGHRAENQDALGQRMVGDWLICVLADGAGGHRGGEVASTHAVNALLNEFALTPTQDANQLLAMVHRVNSGILKSQQLHSELENMHTTLCALVLNQQSGQLVWLHVGDSRVYHFRSSELAARTKDHSVLQWMADHQQTEPVPSRNALYTALGEQPQQLVVEVSPISVAKPGDCVVLCSDGLWEHFSDSELALLTCNLRHDPTCTEHIHQLALDRAKGRADNLSSMFIFVEGVSSSG
ncbi:PP2C family protein-serine/threonine phosphatase [Limnobacter parvus]|uniref:Serine/threonine-protein phosphatase n=1 Tax=Limnobacter parvus TaxID=2939690 RepID=A0ABT1XIR3_9BURK|nr:PP2C family serine/threonine-protein phosphatase [Limnobacter parvus]MCR2747157.1 serine/threonine-protein phosphatase [Limnobacter parvus]